MNDIAALRDALSRAVTPPWCWEQCGDKQDDPVVGIAFPHDDVDCKRPYAGRLQDEGAYRETIALEWQSCDGCSPSSNAALAVAAVNALGPLCDEVEALRKALSDIAEHTDPDGGENYRWDDREGCLDTVFAIARAALGGHHA